MKYSIHGLEIEVNVYQGIMTEQARSACIGKVVNLCRSMPAEEFLSAMEDMSKSLQGTKRSASMLDILDDALASNYTRKYSDDYAPIASLRIAEK